MMTSLVLLVPIVVSVTAAPLQQILDDRLSKGTFTVSPETELGFIKMDSRKSPRRHSTKISDETKETNASQFLLPVDISDDRLSTTPWTISTESGLLISKKSVRPIATKSQSRGSKTPNMSKHDDIKPQIKFLNDVNKSQIDASELGNDVNNFKSQEKAENDGNSESDIKSAQSSVKNTQNGVKNAQRGLKNSQNVKNGGNDVKNAQRNVKSAQNAKSNVKGVQSGQSNVKGAQSGQSNVKGAQSGQSNVKGAQSGQINVESAQSGQNNVKGAHSAQSSVKSAQNAQSNVKNAQNSQSNVKSVQNVKNLPRNTKNGQNTLKITKTSADNSQENTKSAQGNIENTAKVSDNNNKTETKNKAVYPSQTSEKSVTKVESSILENDSTDSRNKVAKRNRKHKGFFFSYPYVPQIRHHYPHYDSNFEDCNFGAEERTPVGKKKYQDSNIYYIKLPPTPYMFVPGLGYVSQPPRYSPPQPPPPPLNPPITHVRPYKPARPPTIYQPHVNPFIKVPIDFISNGKPTSVYQWQDGKLPSRPENQITNLDKGPYVFNGRPSSIYLLRPDGSQTVPQPIRFNDYQTSGYF